MQSISSPVQSNPSRVKLYDLHPPLADFYTEALEGLLKPDKSLSPKFLYDKQGAELFDQICELEEYYLTRTEMAILRSHAAELSQLIGDRTLIEFGSGSSQKIRILLDAMQPPLQTYVALDISKQHLVEACEDLVQYYPELEAIAICADFTQPLTLPPIPQLQSHANVGFFPGSSIGNFEPDDAVQFLGNAAKLLQPGSGFLVGVDLKKSAAILEPAYDDSQGVSAAFALNLLRRMNRELGANFQVENFTYRAFYNPIGRIEMAIVSLIDQVVQIKDTKVSFSAGETLRTEYSYKYSVAEFQEMAIAAGLNPKRVWTDVKQLFSLHYLEVL
jgi:dimethylhistidine N-methyltransferase